jgi:hypothetical protein
MNNPRRLSRHSDSLASLVRNIEGFYHRRTIGNDRIMDSSMPWTAIEFANAQRETVRIEGAWLRIPCKIETEDQNSVHTIAVRLTLRKRNRKLSPGVYGAHSYQWVSDQVQRAGGEGEGKVGCWRLGVQYLFLQEPRAGPRMLSIWSL